MGDGALDLLTTYLSDSAVSPLAKEFIEIDDPLCTGAPPSAAAFFSRPLTDQRRHYVLLD